MGEPIVKAKLYNKYWMALVVGASAPTAPVSYAYATDSGEGLLTRKMISGGASLRSWHQLYSFVSA